MAMKNVRILVVDDHEFIRQGLRAVIEKQPGWEVVGEAVTGREAIALAEQHNPDVVVMDVSMPDINGLEATAQLLRSRPQIKVLVLSMHDSEQIVRQVLASGARGYMLKSDAGRDLVTAIDSLTEGRPFFTPKISELLLSGYLRQTDAGRQEKSEEPNPLTVRETEILQLLADGRSNKEIAGLLNISARTVETHRRNLMSKLNLHSIADVVRYAVKNRITS
jgi:DNA-binding NarL/FixJ family response regulator